MAEHDGCEGCAYILASQNEEPCKNCKGNHTEPNEYPDLWITKEDAEIRRTLAEIKEEFTELELVKRLLDIADKGLEIISRMIEGGKE